MDVVASEFYKEDKSYDLNFKEEGSICYCLLADLSTWPHKEFIPVDQIDRAPINRSIYCRTMMVHKGFLVKHSKICTSLLWPSIRLLQLRIHLTRITGSTIGKMTAEIGEKVQIVGDDLLVTNPKVSEISLLVALPVYIVHDGMMPSAKGR